MGTPVEYLNFPLYTISDKELKEILEDVRRKAYSMWSSGDIMILYCNENKMYKVVKIAECRLYDENLEEVYRSVNKNYEATECKNEGA